MDSPPLPSPTIGQIAKQAGVNRSTVSLALRNDHRIKLVTRQKIQALANEMGYRRNPTVAQLMTQLRAGQQHHFRCNIAALNFGLRPKVEDKVWQGAEARAKMLGYGLELFNVNDTTPQRLEQILVNRGIRGVLLLSLWGIRRLPDDYRRIWNRFACCCVGLHPSNPELHFVGDDNYLTSLTLVEQLAQMGFSRIGLAMESGIDIETEHRFVGGYFAGCHSNPNVKQVPVLLLGKTEREKFLAWFRRVKPEVIICIQEEILHWLREEGVVVPRDVSVAHLDLDAVVNGKWAGMRQDRASRGRFSVDLVVSQLNNDEMGPPSSQIAMLTESAWESGDTLAVPNQGGSPKRNLKIARTSKKEANKS